MSTRTLTYTEYSRLTAQANRVAAAERRAESERRENAELRRRIEELRSQQHTHSATVGSLATANETLRNQLTEANQRVREAGNMRELHERQIRDMGEQINGLNRAIREERNAEEEFRANTRRQLNEIHMEVGDLHRQVASQEQWIQQVANRMAVDRENMNRRAESERERAVQTLEELRRYLADLKPLEIERFMPGTYGMLEQMANEVQDNIDHRLTQAALALAQGACAIATDAYVRGSVYHQAFMERVAEARELAAHAGELIARSEEAAAAEIVERASELENGCPSEAKRPDYWNNGAFEALRRRRDQIASDLANIHNNQWTPDELNGVVRELLQMENETLAVSQETELQVDRYFTYIINGIETILEVLGDGWECIRYEHSVLGDLTSPVQMVFRDGAGHELPMLLDINAGEPEQTRLEMAVVGAGVEDSGEDAQVTLDDITGRLLDHGLRIGTCETDLTNCRRVARTPDTYFEELRRRGQKPQVRNV